MKKKIDKKITLMAGGSAAISYKKRFPNADTEETINNLMKEIVANTEKKIFSVAGASFVLKIIERKPNVTEKELMQSLVNESEKIFSSIENQFLEQTK